LIVSLGVRLLFYCGMYIITRSALVWRKFLCFFCELNSKSNYLRGIPTITQELLASDQTVIDYVANNYSSKSSVYFFGISSAVTSEQKNPFPGTGGFAILYNSPSTGYGSIYAFSHTAQIKNIQSKNAIWGSDWVDL